MVSCWFEVLCKEQIALIEQYFLDVVGWCYSVVTCTRLYTIVIPLLPCPDADKRRQTSSQTVVVDKVVVSPGNRQRLPKASNHSLHRLLCGEKKQHKLTTLIKSICESKILLNNYVKCCIDHRPSCPKCDRFFSLPSLFAGFTESFQVFYFSTTRVKSA